MSPFRAATTGWYGAYELKSNYQRHMTMAILIASLSFMTIMGGALLYKYIQERASFGDDIPIIRITTIRDLAAPPSMTTKPPQIEVAEPDIAPPSIGIPTPVADEEVIEEVRFATRAELAELSAPIVSSDGDGNDSMIIAIPVGDYFPDHTEFVSVEQQPVLVKNSEPIYPEIAELTETEGEVYVQALVDKNGKVRDARIAKSSGSNVGFDEAAIEAAYKRIYRPAIQNGQPVPIWVAYKVVFRMN